MALPGPEGAGTDARRGLHEQVAKHDRDRFGSQDGTTTMNLAVIGVGYWGPNLVRVFSQHPRVGRVTVCDIDPARLERVSKLHPTVKLEGEASRVFDDPGIDAVVVALPVAQHYEMARRALEAGKHVLVEKPLAGSAEEGEALCRLRLRVLLN